MSNPFNGAFMQPEILKARAWHIDTKSEGNLPFFAMTPFNAVFDRGEIVEDDVLAEWAADLIGTTKDDILSVYRDDDVGFYARLSASGYLDCTEWSGPYQTEDEAMRYLIETYADNEGEEE